MNAPLHPEAQLDELNAAMKIVGEQVKAAADRSEKEMARHGQLQTETRAKVDELLSKQGELQARLQDCEQKALHAQEHREPQRPQSLGQMVVHSQELQGVDSSFRGSKRIALPNAAITSLTSSAGVLVQPDRLPGVLTPPDFQLTVRDLLAPGQTTSNSIEYVRETGFTNNAAPVAELALKPESSLTYDETSTPVRTLAHVFKASRQIMDDAPQLASYIDARARYGLRLVEETQLLYGNGTGANLTGIVPLASAYAMPNGAAVTAEQRVDRIRMAMLQATIALFPASGIVLNPIDWASIELLKDTQNRYLIGNPQGTITPTLWNLPVVATTALTQNKFLVGAFNIAAQIFDRMGVEVLISTENEDDFVKNRITLRCEERLALAVYRPEAFIYGSLTGA